MNNSIMAKRRSRGKYRTTSMGFKYEKGSVMDILEKANSNSFNSNRKYTNKSGIDLFNTSTPQPFRYRGEKIRFTPRERHFQAILVLFILVVVGLYFLWRWMAQYVWQSIFILVVLIALFVLLLFASPRFRGFMGGTFWSKLFSFLKPPEDAKQDVPIRENKYPTVPPLAQADKDRLVIKVKNRCEICSEPYGLDVHHIIPRSEGGPNKERNLIVVCPTCHRRAHGGGIPRSRLQYIARNRH